MGIAEREQHLGEVKKVTSDIHLFSAKNLSSQELGVRLLKGAWGSMASPWRSLNDEGRVQCFAPQAAAEIGGVGDKLFSLLGTSDRTCERHYQSRGS